MSFRKDLFKNIVILGGYNYATQILGFISTIILSRLLLPSEYGFVALIAVFTGFFSQFSDAGLSYIIIRSDYKHLFHATINYLSVVIGVILAIIIILLAYPISVFYKNPALFWPTIVMSTGFVLRSFITVPYGILSKELKFKSLGQIELVCSSFEIALMITLAFLKFSYWALIIPYFFGNILRIIMFYSKTGFRFKILKNKYLYVGFRKARGIIGNLTSFNMLNYWARNSDKLIIGKVFNAQSLGIYDRSYKILNLALNVMTGLFGKVLYPSLKDHATKGGDINKEYLNTLGVISLLNFPISVLLIFFAEPLVKLLWSDTWIQVAELLPYIGVLILTQTLNSTIGNIYILYGKERILMLLGIPTNIIIIASIAFGAFFSMVHVLLYYSIVFVVFIIPCDMYWGFKKSFGYENRIILKFWIPKLLLSLLLILAIWYKYKWFTIVFAVLYFFHLIIDQRKDIISTFNFLYARIIGKQTK